MWVKNAEFRPSKISLYKFTKENYKRKKCGPKIPNSELQNFFL